MDVFWYTVYLDRQPHKVHVRLCAALKLTEINKLECGAMPNVTAALPNIGGALCSTPQSLADAQYWSAVQ